MSKSNMFVVVMVILTATLLAACSSKFHKGDQLVAQENITVVTDYNAPTLTKPTCTINKGESVEITGFSSLSQGGSGDKIPLIELSSKGCTGWEIDDTSLNKKLK